ncbi:unnamed protein product, partial [Polarella glacialis]
VTTLTPAAACIVVLMTRLSGDNSGVLVPILADLAAYPGVFQTHAQAALCFRRRQGRTASSRRGKSGAERRLTCAEFKAKEVQRAATGTSEDTLGVLHPISSRSISVCGSLSARSREVPASQGAEAGQAASRIDEDALPPGMKAAASEPSMHRGPPGGHRLCFSQAECVLDLKASGIWPACIFDNLEKPEVVVAQCLSKSFEAAKMSRTPICAGLRLLAGSSNIPHPEKDSAGADSFFIAPGGTAVGVADGVGEWEWRFKCNPRAFADELMQGSNALAAELATQE